MAYAMAVLEYLVIPYEAKETTAPAASTGKLYRVQVGAYKEKANAERMADELKAKGYSVIIKDEQTVFFLRHGHSFGGARFFCLRFGGRH